MSLASALQLCDASSVEELTETYWHYQDSRDFEADMVNALASESMQRPASWLLKFHLEQGFMLDPKLEQQIFASLPGLSHWETRLHILQSLPFFAIAEADKDAAWQFAKDNIAHKNKLVRAWAYNGLHEVARHYPEHIAEVAALLSEAQASEAASVIARIRNILKTGIYDT